MNNETIIEFSFISVPDSDLEIRGEGGEGGGGGRSSRAKIFVEHALHAAKIQFRTLA